MKMRSLLDCHLDITGIPDPSKFNTLLGKPGDIYQFLSDSHQYYKGLMAASSRNSHNVPY